MHKLIVALLILFSCNAFAGEAIQSSVYFSSNAYRPVKSSSAIFDSVMQLMDGKKVESVTISGYADSTGSAELNLVLSGKRAGSVADSLQKRGLDEKLVSVAFYGKDFPRYSNATKESRAQNRRVDIDIKFKPNCPTIYYGPNKEEVQIDSNTFKGIDCEDIRAEFTAVVNQQELDNSQVFTVKTETGETLWSGGMLRCCFNRRGSALPCFGNVILRLPKPLYNNTGMNLYTGKDANGKTVWSLDTSLSLTDKGNVYEITLSCATLCAGVNCDYRKTCVCNACETAFIDNSFPLPGTRNTAVTKRGIILKMADGKTNFNINDVWDECYLQRNHIYNSLSNSAYSYYQQLLSVNARNASTETLPAHNMLGDARLYLCKSPQIPDSAIHLYEWVQPGKSINGSWQLIATPLQKVMSDAGCTMFWFPVTETGLYMISDTTFAQNTLVMKMRKKFVLVDGQTISRKNTQNAPSVVLPVTKEGKTVTAYLSNENEASVNCVFKKRNKYYLFSYTTAKIKELASGKALKIKKKLLKQISGNNVEGALTGTCKSTEEKVSRLCP